MDGQETERDALRMVVLEAVAYEFDMLIVADQLSRWSLPQPARDPGPDPVPWMNWAHNAHIESFLIHARNLLEFFYLKKQSIRARDFIDGAWANIRPPFADTFQLSSFVRTISWPQPMTFGRRFPHGSVMWCCREATSLGGKRSFLQPGSYT
jgi:hypothetical protein